MDDDQFALDFLREKRVLVIPGHGFHWGKPDHFRIIYLSRLSVLKEAMASLREFLETYHQ
jgi:alanine-synthesizing transaminase